VRITGSRLEPTLAEIGLFKQALNSLPPTIGDRNASGLVRISHPAGGKLVYTTDGSIPTLKSSVYSAPIQMPMSGTIKTTVVLPGDRLGVMGSRTFAGLVPSGWKVVAVDSEEVTRGNNAASLAIDGDSSSFWHTRWSDDLKLPHSIAVDMGVQHHIAGFTYLPRQDGLLNGTIEKFRFETSLDGKTWTAAIAEGSFANIHNNPTLQQVNFAPVHARYFRLTALQEIYNNGWTSAAEISVVPVEVTP
jgi:alpha-L-fucosidase